MATGRGSGHGGFVAGAIRMNAVFLHSVCLRELNNFRNLALTTRTFICALVITEFNEQLFADVSGALAPRQAQRK